MSDTPATNLLSQMTMDERMRVFQRYGAELGHLVFAWNRLHDNLSKLFELLLATPSEGMGTAVWYSTDSDFAQRKMLRAAADKANHLAPERRASIVWMLNQIDESLRHKRNDALHSPLAFASGDTGEGETTWVIPDFQSASPRAKSLWDKREAAEFGLDKLFHEYAQFAAALAIYAHQISEALKDPGSPWPDKPALPHAHRTKNRTESSGQTPAK